MNEPNLWVPITLPIDLKHLGKLGEELGEASAAVSRCIIQGMDGSEPTSGRINRDWLEDELADVLANIELVVERFGLNKLRMISRSSKKISFQERWHQQLDETRSITWCDQCDGVGWWEGGRTIKSPCSRCSGTGHAAECKCGEAGCVNRRSAS